MAFSGANCLGMCSLPLALLGNINTHGLIYPQEQVSSLQTAPCPDSIFAKLRPRLATSNDEMNRSLLDFFVEFSVQVLPAISLTFRPLIIVWDALGTITIQPIDVLNFHPPT
jgi:hypothetical protein